MRTVTFTGICKCCYSAVPLLSLSLLKLTEGKKESPKGKTLILGMMSEPRSCQPEGKVFCQIMEKGPDTAGTFIAFYFSFY